MQLKAADDRQPDLDALAALLERPDLDAQQRAKIEREIRQIRAGAAGERDAAYEIEFHSKDRDGRVTIHDLRIEHDGRVAQIDHLILTRLLDVWVLESKHFGEGVAINDFGEWTAFYGGRPYGTPSPVEQNARHIAVLEALFSSGAVELPRRLGIRLKPRIQGLVLVSNNARISRPKSKAARAAIKGLDTVIKAEQLATTLDRDTEQRSLTAVAKVVGADVIEGIGRQLVGLHQPAAFDWPSRFGVKPVPSQPAIPEQAAAAATMPECVNCGRTVSAAVVAYCEQHPDRFGGRLLCYDCQRSTSQRSNAARG